MLNDSDTNTVSKSNIVSNDSVFGPISDDASKEEALDNLKAAYYLESMLKKLESDLKGLRKSFPKSPNFKLKEPVLNKTTVKLQEFTPEPYPKIVFKGFWSNLDMIANLTIVVTAIFAIAMFANGTFVPLGIVGLLVGLGAFVLSGFTAQKERNYKKQVEQTPDYQEQCRQIDAQNKEEEARIAKINEEALRKAAEEDQKKYDEELSVYNKAKRDYELEMKEYTEGPLQKWKDEYAKIEERISETQEAVNEVYDKNIVPIQYRNLAATTYLVAFLGTSRYQLDYAIERYDAAISQKIALKNLDALNASNEILGEILSEERNQTYLNEVMVDISENSNKTLRTLRNVYLFDFGLREYRHYKEKKDKKNQ